ncbi:bifunctional chorismate-binding protein/class IV aminotransferase [Caldimonas tepidiphila]|uniref:bifunctional chorismate-binding protein/class IV aminotransferase n=1 Tax=Caldimonas tepidiphila TaxID=2315841 RepID=UPI00196B9054|nr:bifunctional anthranilate synthase component I family protein/class IV aminotransferase [Caldimonas tepidiphila]
MTSLPPPVFALLDDRDASPARPASRFYTGFVREHRCTDPATLDATWAAVEADQREGLHAVVLADYEWGAKLLGAGERALPADDASALRVLMFRTLQPLSCEQVDDWLRSLDGARDAPGPAGVLDLEDSVDRDGFCTAIHRIHEAIRAGETYQVNYTYRIDGRAHGSPAALYRRLRARQPVPYGAFISLPVDGDDAPQYVLSCSPELFLRHEAGVLTARPMKGTAPRSGDAARDEETARWLAADVKNRAENLMIVDLLRNDLGRIARTGSVKVPALFSVESHATVLQMTSTVQAELAVGMSFPELLRATFPCGSITGAPKHHTMELIADFESTPRGLYTGSIGWIDAPQDGARCGDFCLSVAIRTLTLGAADADGLRPARLGVGAGIVLDSEPDAEFDECRLKARFLTGLDPGFQIFETLLADREGRLQHVAQHLDRLATSAAALGFRLDRDEAGAGLAAHAAALRPGPGHRVRLALSHDGRLQITSAELAPLPAGPVRLLLSAAPVRRSAVFAAHKTTLRDDYDAGVREAERRGAFDTLFFTADGRLTEGGRSNVFVKLDGRWWTPPLADGVLPGTMRARLLADPRWQAGERTIRREELARAQGIVVCNALRGALPAQLLEAAAELQPH